MPWTYQLDTLGVVIYITDYKRINSSQGSAETF